MLFKIFYVAAFYMLLIGVLSYGVYEISKRSIRKRFLKEVDNLVKSNLEDDIIVGAIYQQAYHYMQDYNSVRPALTRVLNEKTEDISGDKLERIMRLIDKNGEVSALMSLPDPIRPVMLRVYNVNESARSDIAHVAWLIKDLEIRSGNKKAIVKIVSLVGTIVTLITIVIKIWNGT